jgi:tetratricopeptide (TPR) repeat protein
MEVTAYEAALAFLTRRDPLPYVEASLAESPNYGDAWAIPAYFASITRRYRESGEFYINAVEVQPDLWTAHAELGQNHLRLNQIQDGIDHIRLAYDNDPFNPVTVNLLTLLDTFINEFVPVNYPDPPVASFPELTLRLHKKERDIIREYARKLSQESIDLYSERYRFTPKEPVIVELYPNHEDFVVRSLGMPGVGILGVTFGYLFSMDSPSAHSDATYHWGTTLWHEMAHVFTVEASDHMVPRWYSEGTSVFEEWNSGPTPGRKIPIDVLEAMNEGKFLSVADLDDGFMRPTYDGQVIVSYMQSGLVFEFIDEAFGFEPVVDMLYLFNDGISPEAAIEQVLGRAIHTAKSKEAHNLPDTYIKAKTAWIDAGE